MDISFCELRCKEVINTLNGKRLGRVVDIVISCNTNKVLGIVVPGDRKIFKSNEDIFIPWKSILKIGDDCILIQFFTAPYDNHCQPNRACEDNNEEYEIKDNAD